jgi:hypothetical protein
VGSTALDDGLDVECEKNRGRYQGLWHQQLKRWICCLQIWGTPERSWLGGENQKLDFKLHHVRHPPQMEMLSGWVN